MDGNRLERHLAQAQRHAVQGASLIAEQRERVAKLERVPWRPLKPLRALAYRLRFVLRNGREDVDRQAVGLREIDSDEIDA